MSKTQEEKGTFETRRIKKERSENIENRLILTNSQEIGLIGESGLRVNGYSGEVIQDIIAAKLGSGQQACKNEKLRGIIEDSLNEDSKNRVQEVFTRIEQLRIEEKLLLYLKLPATLTSNSGNVDPLRQPLNPLGNRYEIHQTIMWIKTHLEEDPDVSLPKQEVYDEYNIFCIRNSMKPLSTADFGKVMKQVYPRVRPRRLGTRGNSRYCYAGMRKRVKLDSPALPSVSEANGVEDFDESITEEMLGAASTLIREWAEGVLGLKFPNLSALARHLVENLSVDTQSLAAVCILSATGDTMASTPKVPETPPSLSVTPVAGKPGKLREAQLQLQKKLQQRENTRDSKQNTRESKEKPDQGSTKHSPIQKSKKSQKSISPTITTTPKINHQPPVTSQRSKKLPRISQQNAVSHQQQQQQQQQNCDNKNSINDDKLLIKNHKSSPEPKQPSKTSRKRPSIEDSQLPKGPSPEKQQKITEEFEKSPKKAAKQKITVLPPNILKSKLQKIDKKINGSENQVLIKDEISSSILDNNFLDKNSKLCTIDPDALDDYLNGGNNSQEPEEELLQYFQQSSSSSSDAEPIPELSVSRSDKVSQLRLILQQNLKNSSVPGTSTEPLTEPICQDDKSVLPLLGTNPNQSRRRVSFETNVIEHHQDGNVNVAMTLTTVPQSPNTRRRIFNFTPISPGPHSPINNRSASKPSSANASPFVSPRNTPVPRSRSTMGPFRASRTANGTGKKQFSRSVSCSAGYLSRNDDSTFVVPTSATCKNTELGKNLFLTNDLQQKQLLINYPSQENLQEIKNTKRSRPDDQEISDYFNGVKGQIGNFNRSQSVPLHRMVNPTLMSPISSTSTPYQGLYAVNPGSGSSVAPTPVPSEFNDFGSTCLLDEVDANFIGDVEEQGFLMEDKVISNENINKILNFLDEDDGKLNIIDGDGIISNGMILGGEGGMVDPVNVLDAVGDQDIQRIMQSRSYPNTPLPAGIGVGFSGFGDDVRPFSATPQVYRESNEPMLSSPTLNSLNLRGEGGASGRGVSELLETNFLEHEAEEEMDPLGNFEGGFQDVDSLGPLFNEVSDGNR